MALSQQGQPLLVSPCFLHTFPVHLVRVSSPLPWSLGYRMIFLAVVWPLLFWSLLASFQFGSGDPPAMGGLSDFTPMDRGDEDYKLLLQNYQSHMPPFQPHHPLSDPGHPSATIMLILYHLAAMGSARLKQRLLGIPFNPAHLSIHPQ